MVTCEGCQYFPIFGAICKKKQGNELISTQTCKFDSRNLLYILTVTPVRHGSPSMSALVALRGLVPKSSLVPASSFELYNDAPPPPPPLRYTCPRDVSISGGAAPLVALSLPPWSFRRDAVKEPDGHYVGMDIRCLNTLISLVLSKPL